MAHLAPCITLTGAPWERLDQRVIDSAVKQWHKCLHACVAANGGHF